METKQGLQDRAVVVTRRRRLLPAAALIFIALVIGGILLTFHWPFSSQKVMQAVQEDWPGKISVQHFHRIYFPRPGCVLMGVTLTKGAGTFAPPLVAIQRVTIKANYHDLLFRPGYISEIFLEGLKIQPVLRAPGRGIHPGRHAGDLHKIRRSLEIRNSRADSQIHQRQITHVL
jgi:hypothetical protein